MVGTGPPLSANASNLGSRFAKPNGTLPSELKLTPPAQSATGPNPLPPKPPLVVLPERIEDSRISVAPLLEYPPPRTVRLVAPDAMLLATVLKEIRMVPP